MSPRAQFVPYSDAEDNDDYVNQDDSEDTFESLRSKLQSNLSDLDSIHEKMQRSLAGEQSSPTFGQTMKTDSQREQMKNQMGRPKQQESNFNPFESKIHEHAEEEEDDLDTQQQMDNSEFERD